MQKEILKNTKESGATYVEMAFSITLFMFIIVTVIELMRFGYTIATLQHVLDTALRSTSISDFSQVKTDTDCQNTPIFKTEPTYRAACAQVLVKELISKHLNKKIDSWDPSEFVHIKRYPKLSSLDQSKIGSLLPPCLNDVGSPISAGTENEYVSICINYKFDLFMGIKKNILTFGITKNEPFAD